MSQEYVVCRQHLGDMINDLDMQNYYNTGHHHVIKVVYSPNYDPRVKWPCSYTDCKNSISTWSVKANETHHTSL